MITKDLNKGFISIGCIDTGKVIKKIHGAHLKQYLTPPNSTKNVSIVDHSSDEGYDHSLVDSPSQSPSSIHDPSDDSRQDTSVDSILPLPPPIVCTPFVQSPSQSPSSIRDTSVDSILPLPPPIVCTPFVYSHHLSRHLIHQ